MARFLSVLVGLCCLLSMSGSALGQGIWVESGGIATTENRIDICETGATCTIRSHLDSTQFTINHRGAGPTRLYYGASLEFRESGGAAMAMRIDSNGRIGVGKSNPQWALDVNGTIRADEVRVTQSGADFVFEEDYVLMTLPEVEAAIRAHRHLPGIPSAKEMAQGVDIGVMQTKLLQKVEELTLYMIELKKENDALKARVEAIGAAK